LLYQLTAAFHLSWTSICFVVCFVSEFKNLSLVGVQVSLKWKSILWLIIYEKKYASEVFSYQNWVSKNNLDYLVNYRMKASMYLKIVMEEPRNLGLNGEGASISFLAFSFNAS